MLAPKKNQPEKIHQAVGKVLAIDSARLELAGHRPDAPPVAIDSARVTDLVHRWLREAQSYPEDVSAQRLAGVLKDDNGLAFTVGFVDGVMRPESLKVAARNLAKLGGITPRFLPWHLRVAIKLGAAVAPTIPGIVIPIARRVLRAMVGHLILDARPDQLAGAIQRLRADGNRLNLNLLGEAVLGESEADKRLTGTRDFLARDDVDYVSIKVSAVVSQLSMWSFDEAVAKVVEKLTPLYELAAASPTPKFINLDMEEYRDLDLTLRVFTAILDQPQLRRLEAGIVLQTYLPDALGAMIALQEWAARRVADGGAPVKVRVVKGANLAMEHVDAVMHDWPMATYDRKVDTDTNYLRVLHWAMTPDRVANLRLGIAGHNIFDIAHLSLLAGDRGIEDAIDFEMLLGMATGQAAAIRKDVGQLLLYTPVVHPDDFDVAIAYLVRRLEENASSDNFMSAVFDLHDSEDLFGRERGRYEASVAALEDPMVVPAPRRDQARPAAVQARPAAASELGDAGDFRNEPDTDPALAPNRAWGRSILARVPRSTLGNDTLAACAVTSADQAVALVTRVREAAPAWAARPANERASVLLAAADQLSARRADLIEVAASETGKMIAEGDVEVSEAIDFARYYAASALDLERVDGAQFVPSRVTVVVPPWNFPVAIPAGGVLAALASGSGVIIKPAPQARRCAAVIVEALWAAGVPREVLVLADAPEGDVARAIIEHPAVGRVILTGSYDTASLFRSWRSDLPLLAETSGKNSIIVTPSADLDLAAADIARSAFGHAGQKCSAASLVILVGEAARSERFRRQLVDATTSMRVGWPDDPTSQVGPVIEPPTGKLLRGLTKLGPGESWLVQPHSLDESGRLWSPGIRDGVRPGSDFHLTEFFGPILGIMTAATLTEAIALQNAVEYGLTAGLHTLDPADVRVWLESVQAGNLYLNRGITGAIVRRQPFGGWKKSAVGAGTKAGGPSYLYGLGTWARADRDRPATATHPPGPVVELLAALDGVVPSEIIDEAFAAAAHIEEDYARTYAAGTDPSALGVERNILRYVPTAATIRLGADAPLADSLTVIVAGLRAGGELAVSAEPDLLPGAVVAALRSLGAQVRGEDEASWLARLGSAAARGQAPARIRLVGEVSGPVWEAVKGEPLVAVWDAPVTASGRIEVLPFVREQAVSMTNHRFGNPTSLLDGILQDES
ncbi:proline dehydrogenase family protein [Rarobacter faecitabidus]|uniref:L-glutamate gamma-semialdehyde dehydrogenase n=1 Tax=Rarobacter faecitabidus TaxID=13243 RepID=A0A542ZWX6_RARFA|nr:proline dehydrogenase family protein [Rarobacter faecitabidus]TQL64857.1 L-proline dehydrogenase [Rarobacter faecitabidus]